MNLNYNDAVPATNNNPSADQPDMLVNTQSIPSWLNVDHWGFQQTTGGQHKQATFINQAVIPPARTVGMATEYSKLAISTGVSNESNLFFTPDNSTNEYQLTRPITASFPLFALLTQNYNPPTAGMNHFGGWTFLPGGMLFQYGKYIPTPPGPVGSGITIPFPVAFSNIPFMISLQPVVTGGNNQIRLYVRSGSVSTTQFITVNTNDSTFTSFYWMAIGT